MFIMRFGLETDRTSIYTWRYYDIERTDFIPRFKIPEAF